MTKITFKKAAREHESVFLGIAGPQGSGKTKSALRVATGIAAVTGGRIKMIDTERGRGSHYADEFDYDIAQLEAPYTYERYMEMIEAASTKPGDVVIVDSASHGHEGQGGLLEQHEQELDRMSGGGNVKRDKLTFAAWIKPKARYNTFVTKLTAKNINCIFCFRARDKLAMVTRNGKSEPISVGWQPIATEGLAFEMTAMLVLPPGSEGVPDLMAQARKLPSYVKAIFKGEQLDESVGRALANWAAGKGGKASAKQPAMRKAEPEQRPEPQGDPRDDPGDVPEGLRRKPEPKKAEPNQTHGQATDPALDKIAYANEAVAMLQGGDISGFLKWWHGLDQDTKYENLTQASYQRFAVEMAKYGDRDTLNDWVNSMTDEERNALAPVRETVRGILKGNRQ